MLRKMGPDICLQSEADLIAVAISEQGKCRLPCKIRRFRRAPARVHNGLTRKHPGKPGLSVATWEPKPGRKNRTWSTHGGVLLKVGFMEKTCLLDKTAEHVKTEPGRRIDMLECPVLVGSELK